MMPRLWTPEDVVQNVAWLKRMNARGNDIYIRPAGEHGLVLLDDLTPDAIERLKGQGYNPAIVTETSRGNLQAWLKLSTDPVDAAVRTLIARNAAREFGGDLNSADAQHYGRLAGFTNQKPQRVQESGYHPFVLLQEWGGQVMAKAREVLDQADRFLDQQAALRAQEERLTAIHTWQSSKGPQWRRKTVLVPPEEYRRQAQNLLVRYGPDPDWSKLDWMIATSMAGAGQYNQKEIEQALVQGSPHIASRKPGHLEDYAHRTATKAWRDPNAQAQRAKNLAKQPDQEWER
jgi:hypothetical protein